MDGSRIAAHVLSGIGIFFLFTSALGNYSGPVGIPLLIFGSIFLLLGLCLYSTSKKSEQPPNPLLRFQPDFQDIRRTLQQAINHTLPEEVNIQDLLFQIRTDSELAHAREFPEYQELFAKYAPSSSGETLLARHQALWAKYKSPPPKHKAGQEEEELD